MEQNNLNEVHYLRAEKRVKHIKGFYAHLVIYLITHCIWMFITYDFDQFESFHKYGFFGKGYGLVSSLILWGLVILVHWYLVFGKNRMFSKDWEEHKIKEFIDKDKL